MFSCSGLKATTTVLLSPTGGPKWFLVPLSEGVERLNVRVEPFEAFLVAIDAKVLVSIVIGGFGGCQAHGRLFSWKAAFQEGKKDNGAAAESTIASGELQETVSFSAVAHNRQSSMCFRNLRRWLTMDGSEMHRS